MNSQITIEELAGYLPWGLKVKDEFSGVVMTLNGLSCDNEEGIWLLGSKVLHRRLYTEIKPLVYPLSALTEVSKQKFEERTDDGFINWFNSDILDFDDIEILSLEHLPYGTINWLIRNHYDIFNWISRGLAIDKRTVK